MSFLIPITFQKHVLVRCSIFPYYIIPDCGSCVAQRALQKLCPAKNKNHTPPANWRVVTLSPDSIADVIQISERCKEIPSTSYLSFFVVLLCLFDIEFFI